MSQDVSSAPSSIENDTDYETLHITGGAAWATLSWGPLIFGEAITRQPISKLFNMISGASGGAANAAIVNTPVTLGSQIPLYSAIEGETGFSETIRYAIPPRMLYYPRQLLMDLVSMGHEAIRSVLNWGCSKLDYALTIAWNYPSQRLHHFFGMRREYKERESYIFRGINCIVLWPINKGMGKLIDRMVQRSKYEIAALNDAMKAALCIGGHPALLKNTIVSHHATAMNVTKDEPAFFAHVKDVDGKEIYTSDNNLSIADITTASCAAQTIFDDFQFDNGDHYSDMADVDTPLSVMSTLQERLGDKFARRKLLIITTGEPNKEDLSRMPLMLFLRQMISTLGSPLMRRRSRYVNKVAMRMLQQNMGPENVDVISISVTPETARIQYADNPKVVRMAKILGFDLLERDEMTVEERMPPPNIFDTSPTTIKKLKGWQWDMVWHNADALVNHYKSALKNSARQGRLPMEEAQRTLEDIEWLYPSGDALPTTDNPPHRSFMNIKEAQDQQPSMLGFQRPQGSGRLKDFFGDFERPQVVVRRPENALLDDQNNITQPHVS